MHFELSISRSILCSLALLRAHRAAIAPAVIPMKNRPRSRSGSKPSVIWSNYLTKSNPMFELIRADLDRKMRGFGVRPEDQTFFRKRITPFLEFGTRSEEHTSELQSRVDIS